MTSCAITIADLNLDFNSDSDPSIDDYCGPYHFGRHLGCIEISRQLLQDNVLSLDQLFSSILFDEHEIQLLTHFYQNKNYDYDYPLPTLPNDFHQISLLRDGYFAEIADTLYILYQNNIINIHTAYDYYNGQAANPRD
jgi:hypothetical protein